MVIASVLQRRRHLQKVGDLLKKWRQMEVEPRPLQSFLLGLVHTRKFPSIFLLRVEPINSYASPVQNFKSSFVPWALSYLRHDCHLVIKPGSQFLSNQANIYDAPLMWPGLGGMLRGLWERTIQFTFTNIYWVSAYAVEVRDPKIS